jgi:hypothetical protein
MLTFLVRLFAGCGHYSTYRERRSLHGAEVMHLVCHDCGHAVPAVQRTAEEHLHVLETGAVRVPRAQPHNTFVVKRGFRKTA